MKETHLKVAVSIVMVIFVSSVVLLSVEATRNYIFNAIMKWQDDYFSIEYNDSKEVPTTNFFKPSYLPEGFEEVYSDTTNEVVRIIYQNEAEISITFKQYPSTSSNILADHENKKFKLIKINKQDAYIFEATEFDKNNIVIWELNGMIL